eukprot:CAMPEP_0174723152 /NCGR_PEP_ID=MMETSP1094-20130205/40189_1 /TAXON_ID=156173 /ORGANISM="Chrysochromulina brevifilum, Strain UTEX LB 985" /LENGTH=387 /DNA_ID=CAMNT_0015924143 /DNA_START=76 /DNA_END=1239 /DNA_ORIENTATION=-
MALKRIGVELSKLAAESSLPYTVTAPEAEAWTCSGALHGPAGSPYEDGIYLFNVTFPENYPFAPPLVTFETSLFHPLLPPLAEMSASGTEAMIWSLAMQAADSAPSSSTGPSGTKDIVIKTLTDKQFIISVHPMQMTLKALYDALQDQAGVPLDEVALVMNFEEDKAQPVGEPSLTRYYGRRLPLHANTAMHGVKLLQLGVVPGVTELTMILGGDRSPFSGAGLAAGIDQNIAQFWRPAMTLTKILDCYVECLTNPRRIPAWAAPAPDAPIAHEYAPAMALLSLGAFEEDAKKWKNKLATTKDTMQLRAAFAVFDQDHSGLLQTEEVLRVLTREGGGSALTTADAQAVIDAFDADKDGQLNVEEFIAMLTGRAHAKFVQKLHSEEAR